MSRLRRFLHIERPRAKAPEGEADAPPDATAGRFGGVERPAKRPARPPGSGAQLDRFGPEPPPQLELLDAGPGERPFTRCMRCGMDHHIFATECTGCGANLDTAQQHEFNERLWSKRQEEAAREARAAAARQAPDDQGADARATGEALAREVAERERRRSETEAEVRGGSLAWLRDLLRGRRR